MYVTRGGSVEYGVRYGRDPKRGYTKFVMLDAKQRLEDLKNKWGVDATTPFKKIDVEKLSDADCRAVLPKALEAAGFLMLCHDANKEIRRLENPLNVKARQCGT